MNRPTLLAVSALALAAVACTTPPVTTPSATFSVTMSELCPQCSFPLPMVSLPASLPPFQVEANQGGLPITVPSQARSLPISSATLNTQIQNQMKVPLTLSLALSKDNAYSADADQLGTVSLDPGAVQTLNSPFDPSLLKNQTIYAGVTVTIGSTSSVPGVTMLQATDAINATTSATVQFKLF